MLKTFKFWSAVSFLSIFSVSPLFAYQLLFTPRAAVTEEYTSNVNLDADTEESDFITTISAGFILQLLEKVSGLQISYDPSYSFYQDLNENDTLRHKAEISGWTKPTKNGELRLRNSYVRTEDPTPLTDIQLFREQVTNPEFQEPIIVPDFTRTGRQPYWVNVTSAGYDYQFGERDSLNLGYRFSILENENPAFSDNMQHSPSIGLTYWLTPMNGLQANLIYVRGVYDDDVEDFDQYSGLLRYSRIFTRHFSGYLQYVHTIRNFDKDIREDYKVYSPSLGVNWAISENTFFNVGTGFFVRENERRDNDSGLTLDGTLGTSWQFKRGAIHLAGSAGFDSSDFTAENLGFNRYYSLGSRGYYDFTRRLFGDASLIYTRREYLDIGIDENRNIGSASAGLLYQILSWMRVGFGYTYLIQDSNLRANEYYEHRLFLSISMAPAIPFRLNP